MKKTTLSTMALLMFLTLKAQPLNNSVQDGYKGIWFNLGQEQDYGFKYSGGPATYTVKHNPMAVYAPAVDRTFFVYGGTTAKEEKHLLCSRNHGKSWKKAMNLTSDSPYNHGYVRRPYGACDPFYAYWCDGSPERQTAVHIYFTDSKGNVYVLPYDMKNEWERVLSYKR